MADKLAVSSVYNDQKFSNLLQDNVNGASLNEDFYKKLIDLKHEQKKTLEYMKDLYNQKQFLKNKIDTSEQQFHELQTTVNINHNSNSNNNNFERNTISAYDNNLTSNNYDVIREYEKQLQLQELHQAQEQHEFDHLVNSQQTNDRYEQKHYEDDDCEICDHDEENHEKYSTKPPLPNQQRVHTVTIVNNDVNHERVLNHIDDNLRRIERMWDSFNLDDFDTKDNIKKHQHKHVFINSAHSFDNNNNTDWSTKITRPQPFSMTVRDEERTRLRKKLQQEKAEAERQRMDIELKESRKPFKATPVPNHVFKPVYEQLIQKEALRARRLYMLSKDYLDKKVKPFNLTEPQKSHSFCVENDYDKDGVEFIANPLPEFYFEDDNITEKMKEDELYRQIRKQIRSYELLQKSKLPRNMALQKIKKQLEVQRDALLNAPSNTKPHTTNDKRRKSYDVPNYDDLYKKFIHEFEAKKIDHHHAVTCKPFSFDAREANKKKTTCSKNHNREIQSAKSTATDSNKKMERPQSANDSMSRFRRSLSACRTPIPFQLNESHRLRESANRKKLDNIEITQARKEYISKMKELKKKKLQTQIASKLKDPDPKELRQNIDRKTRKLKLEKRKEEELFEAELDLINKKIESQKFLFERIDEENARRRAEKRFKDALRNAGLTENDLNVDVKIEPKIARPVSSMS